MNSLNNVIIFGATSAIAEKTARLLVEQGASIYCVGRDKKKLFNIVEDLRIRADNTQKIDFHAEDLLDTSKHKLILDNAKLSLGELDSVLIAYGSLPDQIKCIQSNSETEKAISINATSIISLLTTVANEFEQNNKGVIAVISSVAGDRGRQSNYVYGAAKGMLSIFLQGLRNRLAKYDIDVVTIKPGFVATPMTSHLERKGPLWSSPETIASGIVKAMRSGKNEVYLPGYWRVIMFVIKAIPEAIFKRLSL